MKKITRSQLQDEKVPVPSVWQQQHISNKLDEQMITAERIRSSLEMQLSTINQLLAALLRQAFSGELTTSRSPATLTGLPKVQRSVDGLTEKAAIGTYIVNSSCANPTFGRVKLAKIIYLAETHVGIELGGHYQREAAGPFDPVLYYVEDQADKQGWFTKYERGGDQKGYYYRLGHSSDEGLRLAEHILGERRSEMDRLISLFNQVDSEKAEIIATLFGVWNDFLLEGEHPTDLQIIQDVKENWDQSKQRFTPVQLQNNLNWMRKKGLVPQGRGPKTEGKHGA